MLLKETLTEEEGLGDGEGKSYHKAVFRSFTVLPLSSNDLVVTKENFICRSRYLSLNLRFLTFPNLRQTYDYDCGATVVQAVLAYYGIHIRKDHIMKIAGTSKRDGTSLSGILKVLKKQGLKYQARKMEISEVKKFLEEIGCRKVQESVWLSVKDPRKWVRLKIDSLRLQGKAIVSCLGKDGSLGEEDVIQMISRVFGLSRINDRYTRWLKSAAEVEKEGIFHHGLKFLAILRDDPVLPPELLPADWAGEKAFNLFEQKFRPHINPLGDYLSDI